MLSLPLDQLDMGPFFFDDQMCMFNPLSTANWLIHRTTKQDDFQQIFNCMHLTKWTTVSTHQFVFWFRVFLWCLRIQVCKGNMILCACLPHRFS
jgi:hypothetical protein